MQITVEAVRELRELTGAGVLDCKKTLAEAQGDMEEAARMLRERGLAEVAKRADREAKEGRVECYVHHGNRVGAMVELNCETDFVARTDEFVCLAHDLAMQIVATSPRFLAQEDIPEEVLLEQRAEYRTEFEGNKPPHIVEQIVEGKMAKFYQEACLLEQPFIRDADIRVKELISNLAAKTGEKVILRRFARFELGE